VCCGKTSAGECCGSPATAWSEADNAVLDSLSPFERELRSLLGKDGVE